MLQPAMFFRIFVIILLLSTGVPAFAEAARLTFGAAPGATRTLESESQARRLASGLAEALDDDVTVRLFDDQSQLGQWLNQFAMIDLGVMDAAFLAARPGEFLVIGSADQAGQLFFVARQGATGDLPRRVAATLHSRGGMRTPAPVASPVESTSPAPVAVRPQGSGETVAVAPLVLGLVPGRDGVFASSAEAELFAARLGERLGTPVRARLFDSEQVLADWFCRFRAIDLAVINEPGRRDLLVGDYRPLQRLTATGGAKVLLVARRDLPAARLDEVARTLAAFGPEQRLGEKLTSPGVEPAVVTTPPAPIMPVPPQPPVLPEIPSAPPVPEKPEVAVPAHVLPPLPVVPPSEEAAPAAVQPPGAIAVPPPIMPTPPEPPEWPATPPVPPEEPALPPDVEAVASLPREAAQPVPELAEESLPVATTAVAEPVPEIAAEPPVLPSLPSVDTFRMPASASPVGETAEPETRPSVGTAEVSSEILPKSATPAPLPVLAREPLPAAVVDAPAPVEPAALPAEAVVAEPSPAVAPQEPVVTAQETAPELPFTPVPPQVVASVPGPAAVQDHAAEPVAAALPVEVPVPGGAETAVAQPVPEAIPELPFVPVPPRVIEDGSIPAASQNAATVVPAEEAAPVLAGTDAVPDVIAQPDLPQELRPPGVPLPRPGRPSKAEAPGEEPILLAKLQEPLGRTPKPLPLLPPPDPEPGVVYVAPFITLMVPTEVRERIFDQFIDALNQRGAEQKLKFVILKQSLDKVDRGWLGARKHALGEIYGYVEDSGCCSTDLRTRVRLTYYRANQPEPAMKFEYPVRVFFDHDRSNLTAERQKLADQIAAVLVDELFKALQP